MVPKRLMLLPLVICAAFSWRPAEAAGLKTQLRYPVALAATDEALFVANRRSGTISHIDLKTQQVVRERAVGKELSDLALTPDGRLLLVLDEAEHALVVLRTDLTEVTRQKVPPFPVSVHLASDGVKVFVASLWSRRLTQLRLVRRGKESVSVQTLGELALPFAPRKQLWLPEANRLIVADSFGGKLAVVNPDEMKIAAVRELPAHNIRGLALSPDGKKLLVSHQIGSNLAETNRDDIHWGILMTNVLRWLKLDHVLSPHRKILEGSHVHPLGEPGNAAGDPAEIAINREGMAVVALAGVGQVAFGVEADFTLKRLSVGKRPTAVALSRDGRTAWLANTFGDTLSILDLNEGRLAGSISLGPQPKLSEVDRGEHLFYNAKLSMDGWFSCNSCHTDGHTNGLLTDNLSDGSFGAPKRVLSLLGVAQTAPWAWNGQVESLGEQVRKSSRATMKGRELADQEVRAIVAYLQTLAPPPSLGSLSKIRDDESIVRGRALFHAQKCSRCHRGPSYTSFGKYDVGLKDQVGNRQFNPPSLLGVSQRGPYFHDNRAGSLKDVFQGFGHQLKEPLSKQERMDLLNFLNSL